MSILGRNTKLIEQLIETWKLNSHDKQEQSQHFGSHKQEHTQQSAAL